MQKPLWQHGPEPLIHRVCNMPALIRQTARKDVEPHIVWGPSRAGSLLLGASFFSDLDVKLGFCNVDKFIVRFRLNFRLGQLRPQFLDLRLKLQNRLRKFLFLDLRRWFGGILGFFDSFPVFVNEAPGYYSGG